MIFQNILIALFHAADFLVGFLPDMTEADYTFLTGIAGNITNLKNIIGWANIFFPVQEAFTMLGIYIAAVIVITGVNTGLRIWQALRG